MGTISLNDKTVTENPLNHYRWHYCNAENFLKYCKPNECLYYCYVAHACL